jgi:hypothetical protein
VGFLLLCRQRRCSIVSIPKPVEGFAPAPYDTSPIPEPQYIDRPILVTKPKSGFVYPPPFYSSLPRDPWKEQYLLESSKQMWREVPYKQFLRALLSDTDEWSNMMWYAKPLSLNDFPSKWNGHWTKHIESSLASVATVATAPALVQSLHVHKIQKEQKGELFRAIIEFITYRENTTHAMHFMAEVIGNSDGWRIRRAQWFGIILSENLGNHPTGAEPQERYSSHCWSDSIILTMENDDKKKRDMYCDLKKKWAEDRNLIPSQSLYDCDLII